MKLRGDEAAKVLRAMAEQAVAAEEVRALRKKSYRASRPGDQKQLEQLANLFAHRGHATELPLSRLRSKLFGKKDDGDFDAAWTKNLRNRANNVYAPEVAEQYGPVSLNSDADEVWIELADLSEEELERYREIALARHGRLELLGIGKKNLELTIGEVYVRLSLRARSSKHSRRRVQNLKEHERLRDEDPEGSSHEIERIEQAFRHAHHGSGREQGLFVLGFPGCGKTTALKRLMVSAIKDGFDATRVGLPAGIVPVFARLRNFQESHFDEPFWVFLQEELEALFQDEGHTDLIPPHFGRRLWKRGWLLLLLDGLDEVDATLRAPLTKHLRFVITTCRKLGRAHRFVVSSRPSGLSRGVQLDRRYFLHLDVHPLATEQRQELVRRWFEAAYRARARHSEEPEDKAATRSKVRAEEVVRAIAKVRSVNFAQMVGSPLLLTLLCILADEDGVEKEIPELRTSFMRQALRALVERANHRDPLASFKEVERALLPLAWHMHKDNLDASLSRERFIEVFDEHAHLSGISAEDLLEWLRERVGLIEPYGVRYGFMHLHFQEYLAAACAWSLDQEREKADRKRRRRGPLPESGLDHLVATFGEARWAEVARFYVALPNSQRFYWLLDQIIFDRPALLLEDEGETNPYGLLRECIELASERDLSPLSDLILDDTESLALRLRSAQLLGEQRHDPLREQVAEALLEHNTQPPALAAWAEGILRAREAKGAGTVPGEPFTDLTTNLRFLWVPPGEFTVGSEPDDKEAIDREKPAHLVRLTQGFWLAETPVTNRQYELFVKDAGHQVPESWSDRAYSDPDQPVVTVSWPDALAFCRWLSETSGHPHRLPTEAEWERAARGEDGRRYPWGWEPPTTEHTNFARYIGRPSHVGKYPKGRGPYGHLDLAGNVYEWCADTWAEDYAERKKREPVEDPQVRADNDTGREVEKVVHGGSWLLSARSLRTTCRRGFPPWDRSVGVGFRVCVSPNSEAP